jgi:hypothetical protein
MVIKPLCFCPLGIGYSRAMTQVTFGLQRNLVLIIYSHRISRAHSHSCCVCSRMLANPVQ